MAVDGEGEWLTTIVGTKLSWLVCSYYWYVISAGLTVTAERNDILCRLSQMQPKVRLW